MQKLIEWFSNVSATDPAVWTAVSAGLAVILLFLLVGRRPSRASRAAIVPPTTGGSSADLGVPPAIARHDERRRSIRRQGTPTAIQLIDRKAGRGAKPVEAFVLDRSSGGIRIASEKPFSIGQQLLSRPHNAPEGMDWVELIVRNSKETGDYYELGCQFQKDLELSTLLLFG